MLYPILAELIKLQAASNAGLLKNKYSQRSVTQGDYSSLFRGQGMELDNVRPYIVGDDIRHIDWRVTARTHKPHVKTFQAESDRKIMLIVDANAYMRFGTRGTFKSIQAARAAALLAGMGFKNRDRVGGMVFGDIAGQVQFFPPSRHKAAAWRFLQFLCRPHVAQPQVLLQFALQQLQRNLPTGALIFLLTDLNAILATDPTIYSALKAKSELIFLPIIDPIDASLPQLANLVCADAAGQKVNIAALSQASIRLYAQNWQKDLARLQHLQQKQQIKVIKLYTDQLVHRSINDGLQQLRSH